MISLEEIKKRLIKPEINLKAVAKEIGLPYHQLRAVLFQPNPRYKNIKKISDWLEKDKKING